MDEHRSSRWILWLGTAAIVLGAIDPLEGSLVIATGVSALTVAGYREHLRMRRLLYWGGALTAVGVAALWAMSAIGGVGPSAGRSYWWLLLAAPYPIGWLLSLTGAVRSLRKK